VYKKKQLTPNNRNSYGLMVSCIPPREARGGGRVAPAMYLAGLVQP